MRQTRGTATRSDAAAAGLLRPARSGQVRGAILHAKCILVDGLKALITSANFTEAACEWNIGAGVPTTDRALAQALATQFRRLVQEESLVRQVGW
jgi:phosphatidylserine/phosphatidylglycerophosphate/cardiolipin synthase-like enzyme